MSYLHTNYTKANFEGKPLVVEIKPEAKDRSKAQNRLYWKWLHEIHRKTGNDEDQLHYEFKKKFLIGVLKDDDGEIIYSDHTGLPKHYLAGHDVEEFIGVVKRWGASESVKRLVEVAKNPPFVSERDISKCCGNCVIN
ncbi:hypothetical protein FJV20_12280 [Acinetobacter baumannii]|nr:hypothetical protein FJV20_12280 [Acinetobacter baumannii]